MIFRIDAQLSPSLARWLTERFGVQAFSVQQVGHRDSTDVVIFRAAREAGAVVVTKEATSLASWKRTAPHRRCCGSHRGTPRTPG